MITSKITLSIKNYKARENTLREVIYRLLPWPLCLFLEYFLFGRFACLPGRRIRLLVTCSSLKNLLFLAIN